MLEVPPNAIVLAAAAFLAGGAVKGVIGVGLPLVVVPVVATLLGPREAVALMFVPALTSNVMQAHQAGLRLDALRRFWPGMVGIGVGSMAGSSALARVDPQTAAIALGLVVVLFCLTQLASRLPPISAPSERWLTPIAGVASGIAGGMTGFFGLTLVPYLLALRLPKEHFVATIAMFYLLGVAVLFVNLWRESVLGADVALASLAAAGPTLLGVWIGSRLRRRVPEEAFRRLLLVILTVVALDLIRRALVA